MTEDADDYGESDYAHSPDLDPADDADKAERGVDFARLEAALREEEAGEYPGDGTDMIVRPRLTIRSAPRRTVWSPVLRAFAAKTMRRAPSTMPTRSPLLQFR